MDLPPEWQKSILSILTSVERNCEDISLKLAVQAIRDYRVESSNPIVFGFGVSQRASIALCRYGVLFRFLNNTLGYLHTNFSRQMKRRYLLYTI